MLRAWWAALTSALFPALDYAGPSGPGRTATAPVTSARSLGHAMLPDRYACLDEVGSETGLPGWRWVSRLFHDLYAWRRLGYFQSKFNIF